MLTYQSFERGEEILTQQNHTHVITYPRSYKIAKEGIFTHLFIEFSITDTGQTPVSR